MTRDGKPRQIKIGSKVHQLELAVRTKLRPGNHSIAWRRSSSEDWRSCGTLNVEALAAHKYYEVKLSDESLSTAVRTRGSAK